jgi:hypothetical protein
MRIFFLLLVLLFSQNIPAQTSLPELENLSSAWNTVATNGVCSAGTPYQFHVKPSSNSNNLLIFFNGGGACWFGEACDLDSEPNIHTPFADADVNNPRFSDGIFNLSNPENPFSDYNMVFLPYCTGDVFIGSGPRVYSYTDDSGEQQQYTTYHNGYTNSMEVIEWIYQNFQQSDQIIVAGSSAGAIGSSFYSGLVANHYATTPITLIADGAGGYGSPNLAIPYRAWDTASILPDWPEYSGFTNENLTFEDFYIASSTHNDNLTLAQYNTAHDEVQLSFTHVLGDQPGSFTLPQRILNNYQVIESSVDNFYSYTAGGTVHTILRSPLFYEYEVEGIPFVEWVTDLINKRAISDVSCVKESRGCSQAPNEN